jgi:hypothetical protein
LVRVHFKSYFAPFSLSPKYRLEIYFKADVQSALKRTKSLASLIYQTLFVSLGIYSKAVLRTVQEVGLSKLALKNQGMSLRAQ